MSLYVTDEYLGAWIITDTHGRDIHIAQLPECAVAYDESGCPVEIHDFVDDAIALADAGCSSRASRRILVWACEQDSIDDDGARAIASARWEQP